jgi:ABC-type nitrate/sulfonate/bicarbonate transport system substrate-binding protein
LRAFILMSSLAVFGLGGVLASTADLKKLTVFVGPTPIYDSVWMADAMGFYKEEGLDVQFRLFPSGTTALQTFKTGVGDINFGGDLPGVQYWNETNKNYRLITVLERDAKGYVAAAKKSIARPQDLKGKTIATRVGSTGSWFISVYLQKNGMSTKDVTIKNLDTQILPTALCKGDIDAFFIWQPFPARALEVCPDKVHYLTTAEGYVHGYAVAGARPDWLATPEGRDKAIRFLRATIRGKEVAAKDFAAVAKLAAEKHSLSEKATREQWEINERVLGFDKVFYDDYCSLSAWMKAEGILKAPLDFTQLIWTDGLSAIDPKRVADPPKPC